MFKGRQALLTINKHFDVSMDKYRVFDLRDLMVVKWRGDSRMDLFLDQWKLTVHSLRDEVKDNTLCALLLEQMEKSQHMYQAGNLP